METTSNILLSFIVPVFNGERDIVQCLDSICNQGLKENEYEIICIDDCSSDKSVDIIKNYSNSHGNIRLFQHNKNMKTGTSCNEGIDLAKGIYLWFIGQDDWLEPLHASKLLHQCINDNLDLILFNYNRVRDDGTCISSVPVFKDTNTLNGKEYIDIFFKNNFTTYLLGFEWRSIISTSYIRNYQIRCTEGTIYEDTTILFKAIYYSTRVASCSDFIYNYRINSNSITSGNKRFKGELAFDFSFVAGKEVLELSKKISDIYISNGLKEKANWFFSRFIYKIIPASLSEKRKFYSLVKCHSKETTSLLNNTSVYVRVMAMPRCGYILANLLKPLYLLKHVLFKNKFDSAI